MSTVTRYDCITGVEGGPEMDPFGLGNWVEFDDYEKLEAKLAEAKHRLEWYETRFKPPVQPPTDQWMAEIKE